MCSFAFVIVFVSRGDLGGRLGFVLVLFVMEFRCFLLQICFCERCCR